MPLVPAFRTKYWGLGLSWAWIPLFGFLVASAMILSLLIIWLAQGHPRYKPDEATIVYISDVGAANHALFIVLGCISAVFFFWSLWMDYRLRHSQRIASRARRFESWMSGLSIIAAAVSAICLILLTIFDAFNHQHVHWTCAIIFFIALVVSGIFNMAEIGGLYKDYPEDRLMRASFIAKLIIVILAVIFIIVFAAMQGRCSALTPTGGSDYQYCNAEAGTAAVFEWLLGAIFCLYILTFVLDLYPAKYTSRHHVPSNSKSAAKSAEMVNKRPGAAPALAPSTAVPPSAAFTHGSASPGYPSTVSAVGAGDVVEPMAPMSPYNRDATTMV